MAALKVAGTESDIAPINGFRPFRHFRPRGPRLLVAAKRAFERSTVAGPLIYGKKRCRAQLPGEEISQAGLNFDIRCQSSKFGTLRTLDLAFGSSQFRDRGLRERF